NRYHRESERRRRAQCPDRARARPTREQRYGAPRPTLATDHDAPQPARHTVDHREAQRGQPTLKIQKVASIAPSAIASHRKVIRSLTRAMGEGCLPFGAIAETPNPLAPIRRDKLDWSTVETVGV